VIDEPVRQYQSPVILLGGGELNRELFDDMTARGYPLIAADGGANVLTDDDPTPDLILGDLDSLENRAAWQAKTQVREIAEQDTTDFEKCLYATTAPWYFCFGFLGHRFDHSLATLHTLAKYAGQKAAVVIGRDDFMLVPDGPFSADLNVGDRVSIYPVTPVSFAASSGLAYPLDGLTLSPGVAIGTSNTVTQSAVSIAPMAADHGRYAVILPNSRLNAVTGVVAS